MPALLVALKEDVAALGGAADDRLDRRGRRCRRASSRRSSGCTSGGSGADEVLVDVDADGVDAVGAGGVEDAVAGQAGDLEQDVDVRGEDLVGERLAAAGIVEGLGSRSETKSRLDLDVRVDGLGAVLDSPPCTAETGGML